MCNRVSIVVTTIFRPNQALKSLAKGAIEQKWSFIIAGDVSTPKDFHIDGAEYYDIDSQKELKFKLATLTPEKHYTRKNLAYLIAMAKGSEVIIETDDDNIPNPEFWIPRASHVETNIVSGSGWFNIYTLFTSKKVWPRGFPLEEIHNQKSATVSEKKTVYCPIQQGLADENPDVDAVFRMTEDLPLTFERNGSYYLAKSMWCPFNSQNTTWLKDAFALLYLPSFCSFRMTDIWRSFVAQRVIWECDWGITFHQATVRQERNEHNLIRDFEEEVPGYLNNGRVRRILEDLQLKKGKDEIGNNLMICYEALVRNRILSEKRELDLLAAWLDDLQSIGTNAG